MEISPLAFLLIPHSHNHFPSLFISLQRHMVTHPQSGKGRIVRQQKRERQTEVSTMARGKIQIKRIENSTNRQVTYSKRRSGLFKKAKELTVLCDATVSIIMFSSNNKLHEFLSPGVSLKEIYDRYQEITGVDIWATHYQRMQEELQKLNEIHKGLQRDISRRMGDCLEDLSFDQLHSLEQDMENAAQLIRQR